MAGWSKFLVHESQHIDIVVELVRKYVDLVEIGTIVFEL